MAIDQLTAGIGLAETVIGKIWPDKSAQEAAQLAAAVAIVQGQLDINKAEAASTNWFVAGARPFIMWGCGFSMLYAAMLEPIARFIATVVFHYSGAFPVLDTSLTTPVLLGILGLSGYRTVEKIKGVEGNR